ncbi:MAG: phosphoribosylglycinamide formyltransferase [Bacteroidota bacterium]
MKRIVILASGNGSNAERITTYFANNNDVEVVAFLTNKNTAKVLERAKRLGIPAFSFNKIAFSESDTVVRLLQSLKPDIIVLAGFLWKIPSSIVEAFPDKIINIHPALLPKYGGKGMYGNHVHQAVKDNDETETGITIHYVNEHYDEGAIILQAKVAIQPSDDVERIAHKVHQLEYEHFPKTIEKLLESC